MRADIRTFVLENTFQKITFLNCGATIYKWEIKARENRNIVLTNGRLNDYLNAEAGYFGATIGRVTNRIANGSFLLDGHRYTLVKNFDDNTNAGHGGPTGFAFCFFKGKKKKNKVVFSYFSKEGEEGYPGAVKLVVTYTLEAQNLSVTYQGKTKGTTIMNITNHSYFNLDGSSTILAHKISGYNPFYLELNDLNQVTGSLIATANTRFDFTNGPLLKDVLKHKEVTSKKTRGLDFTFSFPNGELLLQGRDLSLTIKTSYPCIHLYALSVPPLQLLENGKQPQMHHALALEPGYETDAINHATFSNIIFSKKRPYHETITYTINLV